MRELHDALEAKGASVELVGGAYEAAELDAKAAIKQASELAAKISQRKRLFFYRLNIQLSGQTGVAMGVDGVIFF